MNEDFINSSKKQTDFLTSEIEITPCSPRKIYLDGFKWRNPSSGDDESTTSAKITVYKIKLKPAHAEKTDELLQRVNEALQKVAAEQHDFFTAWKGDFSFLSNDYTRPEKDERYARLSDGGTQVELGLELDLDDLWKFYEAMKETIEPCEKVAIQLWKAAFLEARDKGRYESTSSYQRVSGYESDEDAQVEEEREPLTYDDVPEGEKLWMMLNDAAEELVTQWRPKFQEAARQAFFLQICNIAEKTLHGDLVAADKLFPSIPLMLENRQIEKIDHEKLLKDRVSEILTVMFDGRTDPSLSLHQQLEQVLEIIKQTRDVEEEHRVEMEKLIQKVKDSFDKMMSMKIEILPNSSIEKEKPEKKEEEEEILHKNDYAIAVSCKELTVAQGEIPQQLPFDYYSTFFEFKLREKLHMTRNAGDMPLRLALPENLLPFVKTYNASGMQNLLGEGEFQANPEL